MRVDASLSLRFDKAPSIDSVGVGRLLGARLRRAELERRFLFTTEARMSWVYCESSLQSRKPSLALSESGQRLCRLKAESTANGRLALVHGEVLNTSSDRQNVNVCMAPSRSPCTSREVAVR